MTNRPSFMLDSDPEGDLRSTRTGSLVFVTLTSGRAHPGEEDAIVALHEDWVRRRSGDAGLLSSEILIDPVDPRSFLAISHFVDQAAAERSLDDPEHSAWRRRLASLSEASPVERDMLSLWRAAALPSAAPTQPGRSGGNENAC